MTLKNLISQLIRKKEDNDIIDNTHKVKKLFFTGNEQLTISAASDATAEEVSKMAYNILQKYKNQPENILRYMEAKDTRIVVAKGLLPILKFLGYDEGFIPAHNSIKGMVLNIIVCKILKEKITLSCDFKDTLFICKKELSMYFLAYHFHHWLSCKNKLPGYDYETLHLFRSTLGTNASLSKLSINQILSIKDAVERDKQAIDFVTDFVRKQIGAKSCIENITNGKPVNI